MRLYNRLAAALVEFEVTAASVDPLHETSTSRHPARRLVCCICKPRDCSSTIVRSHTEAGLFSPYSCQHLRPFISDITVTEETEAAASVSDAGALAQRVAEGRRSHGEWAAAAAPRAAPRDRYEGTSIKICLFIILQCQLAHHCVLSSI